MSKNQGSQGWSLPRPLSWARGRPPSPYVLAWSSLCAWLCPDSLFSPGWAGLSELTPSPSPGKQQDLSKGLSR